MKRDWKRNIKVVWLCGAMIGFVTVSASWSTPARAQVIILNAQTPNADAIYDVPALISTPLNAKVLKSSEEDGIVTEEVMFHSEMDGAKSVDIFAIFSYPKGAKNLPAFIWNQTGLAQASSYLTVLGARRGYAALCIDFPNTGYRSTGNYAINSGLEVSENPRDSPIYHGAVALLKAVSYLQSRPEVNGDRIGMVGSSWGGFFTTVMAGIDPRLKAASAMFGTGNLQLGNAWWDGNRKTRERPEAERERWRTTLDPALRLPTSKVPIAWFSGTNDSYYWMPALMKSYAMANENKSLTLMPNWDHGLPPQLDEQVFVWLDSHLKAAPQFLKVAPIQLKKQGKAVLAQWQYSGPREVTSAELILSYGGDENWVRRVWSTLPVTWKDGAATVALPSSTIPFYISGTMIDKDGFRYSTPLLEVGPSTFGKKPKPQMLVPNGATTWGGFEESDIRFLKGMAFPTPAVSDDAHSGKQAAKLVAGQNGFAPLLFTTGVAHQFSAWVKADKATTLKLEMKAQFDGIAKTASQEYSIGTRWTIITFAFPIPAAKLADVGVILIAPENASILVDDVSFVPVWKK